MTPPADEVKLDEILEELQYEVEVSEYGWAEGGAKVSDKAISKAKQAIQSLLAEARIDELNKTVEICDGVIETWSKHAYSMEALVNDSLVYLKSATKEQLDRRNNDVTDRRAILLTSAIPKHLKDRIALLQKEESMISKSHS